MSVAEFDGARIEYFEAGASNRPTVVFFHGLGGVETKAAFMPMLAERYRVIAPTRPGFDGSTGPGDTAREAGETMAGFLRQVSSEPVHLMAESAGGGPACWLAIEHPELLASLILAAPAPLADRPAHQGPPPTPQQMNERLFGTQPAWTAPPDADDAARRRRNAESNVARTASPELRERLGDIKTPTLILWGTADQLIPAEHGRLYEKHIHGSILMYIYGAAHALPVSAAQQTVKLVSEFIDHGDAFLVNQPQL